jgi:protein-S-isoprenylcysteine O-methyltransferase Ste14
VWLVLERRQAFNERPEAMRTERASTRVLLSAVAVGFAVAFVAARSVPAAMIRPAEVAGWVGLGMMWSGIGLRLWSFRTLGRYFTFAIETSHDQPLITAGPYRVIRHPSYAALLVALIGVGVEIGNWVSLVGLTVATVCGLVYRISAEERALTQVLGSAYRDYAAAHKRLVPFIW